MTSNLLRSTLAAIALTFTAAPALAQTQPSIDGRWEGPVDLPNGTTITAVFRVADNATTAVFDSPEQGAKGIEATVKRDGPKVTLTVPMAMLVYNATLSADGKTLSGGLSQGGGILSLTMTQKPEAPRLFMTGPAVQGLDGRWEGMIVTGGGDLTGVFRISTAGKETTTLMDSPVQSAFDMAAITSRAGNKVTIDVPGVGGGFEGELGAEGKTIVGAWIQNGQNFPLVLTRK